jgi:hypothetical protein
MGGIYSTHEEVEKCVQDLAGNTEGREKSSGGHCYCVLLIPVTAPSIVGSVIWL